MTEPHHMHKPVLVQAPVRALDPDGVAVVGAGTVAFAIGAVICWFSRDALALTGRAWYFGVAVTGTVLGLLVLAFGFNRKRLRARPSEVGELTADAPPPAE